MEVRVDLNALILAVTRDQPRVMTITWNEVTALPFGDLDADRTLELALRRWVQQQTGLELGYVEQLYTFGDRSRDSRAKVRLISIAYLALVREAGIPPNTQASWRNVYDFLPWEDWRNGPPTRLNQHLDPWMERQDSQGQLRAQVTFGLKGSPWDGERALERYELLYEMGLVQEAQATADQGLKQGEAMALDHRRILATGLARIRGKLGYRPVIFEMLPEQFTLLQLQKAVEALAGIPVHKQNFRRLVEQAGLVEGTGQKTQVIGRPAELFRFRREVLRERPAPGVGRPKL